ncbi:hypothetical protein Tco_0222295 [Tanacetum coccineum]
MAKAHLFAQRSGPRHNVSMSNIELKRWVQFFQQLLTDGNQALRSLKLGFHHTYIFSLDPSEGEYVVTEAIDSFISILNYVRILLCAYLKDGTTLMVRDFVWYSIETSVRQNFMYLEYLGAQVASQLSRVALGSCTMELVQCQSDSTRAYVTDLGMLHDMVSPKVDGAGLNSLKYKKYFFAANWTTEEATENDRKLYVLRLEWLSDQLQGHCLFFSFLKLLNEEMHHPIWNCIGQSREVLNKDLSMLSHDLAKLTGNQLLTNTKLEERILGMLVESPYFDVLFELYRMLIDDHLSAWTGLVSSQFDYMLISWLPSM